MDDLAEALAKLTTAGESIFCAALVRGGQPSKGQWDEFNEALDAANDLLVRVGYLCDICRGCGDDQVEPMPRKCWKCQGSGKLVHSS